MSADTEPEGLSDLQNHGDACDTVWRIAQEIRALSRSFKETGNLIVYRRLQEYADSLDGAVETIRVSQRREFYRSHTLAMQSPWNVLQATLAGIEIGQKSNEGTS